MGANEGYYGNVPRIPLRWRVDKQLGGKWVTMGWFSDGLDALKAISNGFGGLCRITEETHRAVA